MQRAHPAQGIGLGRAAPQRIDLGQGKFLMTSGRISASTSSVAAPLRLDDRDIELAALLVRLDPRLVEARPGRRFSKSPGSRRRARRRAGLSFPRAGRAGGWAGRRHVASSRRGVTKLSAASKVRPRSIRAPVTSFLRSAAAWACIRAGISSEKSSNRRSGMRALQGEMRRIVSGCEAIGANAKGRLRERPFRATASRCSANRACAIGRKTQKPPPSVFSQAAPQALASSRTRRI